MYFRSFFLSHFSDVVVGYIYSQQKRNNEKSWILLKREERKNKRKKKHLSLFMFRLRVEYRIIGMGIVHGFREG